MNALETKMQQLMLQIKGKAPSILCCSKAIGTRFSYGNLSLHQNGMRWLTSKIGKLDIMYSDLVGIFVDGHTFTLLLSTPSPNDKIVFAFTEAEFYKNPHSGFPYTAGYYTKIKAEFVEFIAELGRRTSFTVIYPEDL